MASFVHNLWKFDFGDRIGFDLLWGENTKLDLSDLADWSRRICELVAKHVQELIILTREQRAKMGVVVAEVDRE